MTECNLRNEVCGFRCTGYPGSKVWQKLHELPKEIECEECSNHAAMLFKGVHDHVNAGLGKHVFNKVNYNNFVDEVICVRDKCKRDGRC